MIIIDGMGNDALELGLIVPAEPDETNKQHLETLGEAMEKFLERNKLRKDLWAQFEIDDAIHHAKSKLARVEALAESFGDEKVGAQARREAFDDALDLINYATFIARHIAGRLGK